MSYLGLFPSRGTHPGITKSLPSNNVIANGMPVLLNPYWVCFYEDHMPGIMQPQSINDRVIINGMGAGLSYKSINTNCGAILIGGSRNVMVGN